MSKLQELINKLCPNGVEFKPLREIGDFFGGLTGKSKEDFIDGNARFISYMNVYSNPALKLDLPDFVKINDGEKQNVVQYGDILFTGSSETPNECGMSSVVTTKQSEPLYLNSFCFGFRLIDINTFNLDFLKHLLRSYEVRCQIAKTANGVTRFNISKKLFANIMIPVPPIEVQEEIVRILDSFSDYAAELQAELQARKQQYEYYRNLLLTFNPSAYGCGTDDEQKDGVTTWWGHNYKIEWKKMGDVFEMRNGYTPSKNNSEFWVGGTIPWFRMDDIRENGRILSDSIQHITPSAIKGKGLFEANSFILATTATIGEHALIIADSLANQQFTNLKVRKSLSNLLVTKFIYYYMFIVDDFCKKNTNVSGFASVDMDKLKRMPFPIPPLELQEKIVAILDRFETLVNDLTNGLPAEIAAVKDQYEYYRNKLLTFKKLSA
ncbi:MAG: restriction endonuclease subunit S [Bacteroidales bacterium]|nr:restriction endonuclease subunit S [Bacteroidales bacterium]